MGRMTLNTPELAQAALWALGVEDPQVKFSAYGDFMFASTTRNRANPIRHKLEVAYRPDREDMRVVAAMLIDIGNTSIHTPRPSGLSGARGKTAA